MFLKLNHQKLSIYKVSKLLVVEAYKFTSKLPSEEKFGMISQIRIASLSVHLNISEGASRSSETERIRFYEIARGSLIEVDSAIDIACQLNYVKNSELEVFGSIIIECFKILSGLMK